MNSSYLKYGLSVLSLAVLGGALYLASGAFSAEDLSQSVGVSNSAPTLNTPLIGSAANGSPFATEGSGGIDLTAGTDTTVYVYGVATDLNSCQEINAAADYTITFYHSTAEGSPVEAGPNACDPGTPSSNANKCVTVETSDITLGAVNACSSGTDTDISYSAAVTLPYYLLVSTDDAEDWKAFVTVNDGSATGVATSGAYDINPLKALSVTSSVNYGTLSLGGTSTGQSITFTNEGNSNTALGITSTDFTCSAGSFGDDRVKLGMTGFAYDDATHGGADVYTIAALETAWDSGNGTSLDIGLGAPEDANPVTQSVDLRLRLPSSGVSGTCSSTISFTAD